VRKLINHAKVSEVMQRWKQRERGEADAGLERMAGAGRRSPHSASRGIARVDLSAFERGLVQASDLEAGSAASRSTSGHDRLARRGGLGCSSASSEPEPRSPVTLPRVEGNSQSSSSSSVASDRDDQEDYSLDVMDSRGVSPPYAG